MKSSNSGENLVFDFHTIRLLIGIIAIFFPFVVALRAAQITPSISWSYHTDARDFFVGLLFVIGAFLMSYKGHKFEEDLVGWVGGIAAWVTALYPTAKCIGEGCPPDAKSVIHYIGAIILFSTTVYFCLVAFIRRAKNKLDEDRGTSENPKFNPVKLRIGIYKFCGWGIIVVLIGATILKRLQMDATSTIVFWAETAALFLFGFAWLVASQYLPFVTYKEKRQITPIEKLLSDKA